MAKAKTAAKKTRKKPAIKPVKQPGHGICSCGEVEICVNKLIVSNTAELYESEDPPIDGNYVWWCSKCGKLSVRGQKTFSISMVQKGASWAAHLEDDEELLGKLKRLAQKMTQETPWRDPVTIHEAFRLVCHESYDLNNLPDEEPLAIGPASEDNNDPKK